MRRYLDPKCHTVFSTSKVILVRTNSFVNFFDIFMQFWFLRGKSTTITHPRTSYRVIRSRWQQISTSNTTRNLFALVKTVLRTCIASRLSTNVVSSASRNRSLSLCDLSDGSFRKTDVKRKSYARYGHESKFDPTWGLKWQHSNNITCELLHEIHFQSLFFVLKTHFSLLLKNSIFLS